MSEHLSPGHESHKPVESEKPSEGLHEHHEAPKHTTEHHVKHHESVEALSKRVEQEAKKTEKVQLEADKAPPTHHQPHANKELKSLTLQRTLTRTRKRLPATEKVFSKFIHQPIVDGLSNVGEKTVGRPIGLLCGALLAFLGSVYVLFAAKYYGFQYNLFVFIALFIAGFIAGTFIEMVVALSRKIK